MVYTPEEKQRMDGLMKVFGDYLAASESVDVVYSEKVGYVRLIIADHADSFFFKIYGFDDMLEMFFSDALYDEVREVYYKDMTNRDMDYDGIYNRLKVYVDAMGEEREHALKKLDEFIEKWRNSELLP